jgi:hypothetical protein
MTLRPLVVATSGVMMPSIASPIKRKSLTQSNSFLTSANQYDNDGEPSDSSSSGSDDLVEMAERESKCPQPERPFFHRYDVVVNIPKNSNPTETVTTLIVDVWNILMGIDVDVILYPYRASYEFPALASPDPLLMLGGISTIMSTKENSTASRPGQYPIAGCPLRLAPEANRLNYANPPGTSCTLSACRCTLNY